MSIFPEYEYVHRTNESLRYLEHGWPSELCRWHSHSEYELHCIVKTRGRTFVGDYVGEFQAGSLFLIGPHLPHNWTTDTAHYSHVDLRDMLVQFSSDTLSSLCKTFTEFNVLAPMLQRAYWGLEFIDYPLSLSQPQFSAIRDSKGVDRILAFLDFLIDINTHAHNKPEHSKILSMISFSNTMDQAKQSRVSKVVDHITQNYHQHMAIEQAAEMAAMSPSSFARNFKRITGNQFVEFVNRVRIGQACAMLYHTDDPISSICFAVGFRNLSNFNRRFHKIKNMTPSSYRSLSKSELAPNIHYPSQ